MRRGQAPSARRRPTSWLRAENCASNRRDRPNTAATSATAENTSNSAMAGCGTETLACHSAMGRSTTARAGLACVDGACAARWALRCAVSAPRAASSGSSAQVSTNGVSEASSASKLVGSSPQATWSLGTVRSSAKADSGRNTPGCENHDSSNSGG
jgi:hypothetical protein